MRSVIFDIDLTLVDTTILEEARHKRAWQLAYSMIPQCALYDGLDDVFAFITNNNVKTCIVSTSPRPYIERLVNYFHIPCQFIVGYHDAHPIKPHSAPFFKALVIMGEKANNVISFGDRTIDIIASNAANIKSVACFWGTKEKEQLKYSGYTYAISRPGEIIPLIIN